MVVRRDLLLAWLALTLTALAPVFAYTHIHVGAGGEIIEHCAADEPADTDAPHDHSHSNKGTAPHCPYCPGFTAGAALAQGVLPPAQPVAIAAASVGAPLRHVLGAPRFASRNSAPLPPPPDRKRPCASTEFRRDAPFAFAPQFPVDLTHAPALPRRGCIAVG